MRGSAGFSPRERFRQIKQPASAAEGTNFERAFDFFCKLNSRWNNIPQWNSDHLYRETKTQIIANRLDPFHKAKEK
jgi:hypothetical protein